MAAMWVVCSPEHTGQAFTGALPVAMAAAAAVGPRQGGADLLHPGVLLHFKNLGRHGKAAAENETQHAQHQNRIQYSRHLAPP